MKKALITGITGQDGAYLAELLLEKGYEVHGLKRRSSIFNTNRIDHLYQDPHDKNYRFRLHYGDLTDSSNIIRVIQEIQPDEIYNLGAMSHVKVSFEMPEYAANVDALGTLRILEAVRLLGLTNKTKVYQASTSELYGLVQEIPQKETTPFYPRSPYAVAKLYGYWITVNYREAYNMFAVNGLLFNHETTTSFMPVIYKIGENGFVNIKSIGEVVQYHTKPNEIAIDESQKHYQETAVSTDLYVWDASGWTKVLYASAYPHDVSADNKSPRFLVAKNAAYMATGNHECIMENEQAKEFKDIVIGDKVNIMDYPTIEEENFGISEQEAELLGAIIGDGYVTNKKVQLTSKSKEKLAYFEEIWLSMDMSNKVTYWQTPSGFNKREMIWQMRLTGIANKWAKKYELYTIAQKKRIPFQILNSPKNIQLSFLKGYNYADGLKSNPCVYEFKNFKTNSATLAAGLVFLLKKTTGQEYNINLEYVHNFGKNRIYYSINILSDSKKGQNHRNSIQKYELVKAAIAEGKGQRQTNRDTGISRSFISKVEKGYIPDGRHPLTKANNVIKKIIDLPDYDGWFYDITTESGTFHCGIGQGHVHNSPLRGETFVTRKITRAVARIALGLQEKCYLGNLDAKRDWGHAKDYVHAMWLMLQQDKPEDYVIATGEAHSVRDFVKFAFQEVGMEIEFKGEGIDEKGTVKACNNEKFQLPIGTEVIAVDERYFRPTEVELLIGDPSKAKKELNWQPEYTLQSLVAEMVQEDLKLFEKDVYLKEAGHQVLNYFE